MTKRRELTDDEKALLPQFVEKYKKQHTEQVPYEDVKDAVYKLWTHFEDCPAEPDVILCDSPMACNEQCRSDGYDLKDFDTYWATWFTAYCGMYDFANTIGVEMDQDELALFLAWGRCCPFVLFARNGSRVYVSRNPINLFLDEDNRLHNESGKACEFADGWGVWCINDVDVDEQIVMRPETQTIEQIRGEQNAEVKRLRIERYGWDRYFDEIDARLIDERTNDIEGTKEFLLEGDGMKVLLCVCPSTGKEFTLEVSEDIQTCFDAQNYLSGGLAGRIISAS